jgi:transcription elongation factor GreA
MEADPLSGKISDESPLGKQLIGKKVGDSVLVKNSPSVNYKVISIS